MTSGGQIAISLGMLALIAGGSLVGWIVLFRRADRGERRAGPTGTPPPERP